MVIRIINRKLKGQEIGYFILQKQKSFLGLKYWKTIDEINIGIDGSYYVDVLQFKNLDDILKYVDMQIVKEEIVGYIKIK